MTAPIETTENPGPEKEKRPGHAAPGRWANSFPLTWTAWRGWR